MKSNNFIQHTPNVLQYTILSLGDSRNCRFEKKNSFCNYPSASSYFFSSLRLFFDDICTLPMRQRMRKEEHTKSLFLTINENEDD